MRCIYCQTEQIFFLHKNDYDIYRCPSCGIGQTDLHESYQSFLKRLYDKHYFTGGKERNAYSNYAQDKPIILKNMQKFLKEILQYKQKGTLLDVGCAMGFFVELAKQQGFDAYGIDPSEFAALAAKQLVGDQQIRIGTLQTLSFKKASYDVITLFDVFEHVDNPADTLKKIHTLLKPGGIVVIATGDTGSLWSKLLQKHWTFYIPPQHLFFLNRVNMALLLRKEKFTPLKFTKIGKWLSLEYTLHLAETAAMLPFSRQIRTIAKRLSLLRIPIFLPVGDNMLVIAQKAA